MDRKCSRCGTTEGRFVKIARSASGRQFFYCRECNTESCRRYKAKPDGARKFREAVRASMERLPERQAARILLNASVRKGAIVRPDRCSKCGEVRKVDGHHDDYSRPLEVRWLCRQCHADLHREGNKV